MTRLKDQYVCEACSNRTNEIKHRAGGRERMLYFGLAIAAGGWVVARYILKLI